MDLFRYSAPGKRDLTASASTAYFSINSGTTDLDNWNTNPSGDIGDWAASAGTDAYLAFSPSGKSTRSPRLTHQHGCPRLGSRRRSRVASGETVYFLRPDQQRAHGPQRRHTEVRSGGITTNTL